MFVQLDGAGRVVNIFPAAQQDVETVEIQDDDARIAAFRDRQRAGSRLAAIKANGCVIQSTAMPVLNTTWALDATTMDQIGAVARDYKAGLGLPLGQQAFAYPDRSRAMVIMSGDQVAALYQALRDYTALASQYTAGMVADPPAQPFVIA